MYLDSKLGCQSFLPLKTVNPKDAPIAVFSIPLGSQNSLVSKKNGPTFQQAGGHVSRFSAVRLSNLKQ